MSKGALHDLIRVSIEKFIGMIKCMPNSDKKVVLKYFEHHLIVLESH